MNYKAVLLTSLAIASKYVLAQKVCNTTSNGDVGIVIGTQQDFDDKLAGCHTITGRLWVGNNYLGPLNMSGVVNLTDLTAHKNTSGLTNLIMDNLEHISLLTLSRVPAMENFTLPRLITIGMAIIEPDKPLHVNFPSLKTVEGFLRLEGPIASFNVPQLTTAASLGVRNKYPKTVIGRATAFEFPSLEDVNKLEFYGNNFTSVSLPILNTIRESFTFNAAPNINLEIPLLRKTNSTSITSLSAPSFPLLSQSAGSFSVDIRQASNVTFPNLTWAEDIEISGRVLDVTLPQLQTATGLRVFNNLPAKTLGNGKLNCTGVDIAWTRIQSAWPSGKPPTSTCWGKSNKCGVKTCLQDEPVASKRTQVLIGVIVGLAGLLLLLISLAWCMKRRKTKAAMRIAGLESSQYEEMGRPRNRASMDSSYSLDSGTRDGTGAGTRAQRRNSVESLPPAYTEDERVPAYTRKPGMAEQSLLRNGSVLSSNNGRGRP